MSASDHDAIYRRLFAHDTMVEDLLRRFVGGDWLERLRFETLELVPAHYVSDDLRHREDDRVWRLRYQPEDSDSLDEPNWFYVYILLEFQSTSPRFMALRLLVYLGLLYQDISKKLSAGEKLPPVLPVVLYNGKRPWTAPLRLEDLVEDAPERIERYQPRFSYFLLDEARHPSEALQAPESPVSAVLRMEQASSPEDLVHEIGRLLELVESSDNLEWLREEFLRWLKRVILPRRFPEAKIRELRDLEELRTMLEETVDGWTREWEAQGYRKGVEAGRQAGMEAGMEAGRRAGRGDGARQIFLYLLEKRFGRPADEIRRRVEGASVEKIERWSDRLFEAGDLDALFSES